MFAVRRLKQTTLSPPQWEGTTEDGKEIYIKHSMDILQAEVDGEVVYLESAPTERMKTKEMQDSMVRVFKW